MIAIVDLRSLVGETASPQDPLAPMAQAEAAVKALQAAGAKVRLQRYEGGHGWHGNVWATIRDGIGWLDQQVGTP